MKRDSAGLAVYEEHPEREFRAYLVMRLHRFCIALLLLFLAAGPALAQEVSDAPQQKFAQMADGWRQTLDQVQADLHNADLTREQLDALLAKASDVLQSAGAARSIVTERRKPLANELTALGPEPEKGQPAESLDVASQRRQLLIQIGVFDARIKQAELAIARATTLQGGITRRSNALLAKRLLLREPPVLSLSVLSAATSQLGHVLAALAAAPGDWWQSNESAKISPENAAGLALIVVVAFGAAWPLRAWLLRRFGRSKEIAEPSYARRALAVAVEGFARGMLPAIGLLAVTGLVMGEDIANHLFGRMVGGAIVGIVFFSVTGAIVRAALSPAAPNWRIVPLSAESSRFIAHRLVAIAAVTAAALAIGIAIGQFREECRELFRVIGLVIDTLAAIFALTLLKRGLWLRDGAETEVKSVDESEAEPKPGANKKPSLFWPVLRVSMAVALVAVPLLALVGYSNLATHIITRLVVTGLLVGAILLFRVLIRELFEAIIAHESQHSSRLRRALALSDQGSRILVFWLCAALDVILILPGVGLALRIWGVPSSSIGIWTGSLLHGIDVGNLHFSLGDIALAVIVFVGFLTVTRVSQRLLSDKFLPQTRLDQGVRHSLTAMVGYVGFILAGAFAVSALGLNLANLAIIAGALSVGIGFGLQNIVNNFVSGLILLIERPIKVGDWVVVGQNQGYVTRISVRATEIETFERASVIVPNSELLSSAVVNWTHRDKYGRVDIKVGVAYGSDTAKVRDILLGCARENRQILAWPQPYVLFRQFGSDGLEFELRGYVSDVEKSAFISSDLHFSVDKEFRAAGIEIPFTQRDLRIRNVDEIARAITESADRRTSAPRADQRDSVASAHPPSRRV